MADPVFFAHRLRQVKEWFNAHDAVPRNVEPRGWTYLNDDMHAVEIIETCLGDYYLLDTDCHVWFFDHEEVGLMKCNVDVADLTYRFLIDNDSILDPFENGASLNESHGSMEDSHEDQDSPLIVLEHALDEAIGRLSGFANLALALRGCFRAIDLARSLDNTKMLQLELGELRDLLSRAEMYVTTGHKLDTSYESDLRNASESANDRWKQLYAENDRVSACNILCAYSIPSIGEACSPIAGIEAASDAAGWCSEVLVDPDSRDKQVQSSIADVKYLETLNLGSPKVMGKHVPQFFFKRKLWVSDP